MNTNRVDILNRQITIQRCVLSADGIEYQFMGSSEFEFGWQAENLELLLRGEFCIQELNISFFKIKNPIKIFIVAGKYFPKKRYTEFLEKLLNESIPTTEPIYLEDMLMKMNGLSSKMLFDLTNVDAWFDFQLRVFFTITEEKANLVFQALESMKAERKKAESLELTAFKKKLHRLIRSLKKRKIKCNLTRRNLLSAKTSYNIRLQEDQSEFEVYFNPENSDIYQDGWFTLLELNQLLDKKGQAMKPRSRLLC